MNIKKLRENGGELYLQGQVADAFKIYNKLINLKEYEKTVLLDDKINDLQGLSSMSGYLGLHDKTLNYAKQIFDLDSKNFNSVITLSISFLHVQNYQEAIKYALLAQKINNTDFTIYDILAEAYMNIEDFHNSKLSGIQSLHLKEKNAEKYSQNSNVISKKYEAKPLNTNDKSKNIISFTLFGNSPRYCENAVINAQKVSRIYPHWSCRFYCGENVPQGIIQRLKESDAEVIIKPTPADEKEMLFWRFLVMSDNDVDRYIIRDCDSVINEKEALGVGEWVESKKSFHIMRDFYTHTDLILAGMFGGIGGLFENISSLISEFLAQTHTSRTHLDQLFLSQNIWPCIKENVLIHDSCFSTSDSKSVDFPSYVSKQNRFHIGMNEGTATLHVALAKKTTLEETRWSVLDEKQRQICSYSSKIINNAYSAEIPTSYALKIQEGVYSIKTIM